MSQLSVTSNGTVVVPVVPEGGNTISPSVRISPAKAWCFTWNNYTEDDIGSMVPRFQELAKKYYFAKEVGESGTPHLQGTVEFKKKIRPLSLRLSPSIHWEKRKGTWDQSVAYCQKDDGEKYQHGFKPKRPLKPLACELIMFPWQQSVLDMVQREPDDRTIVWIWEDLGAVGKTTFLKYLMRFEEAIPLEGKKADCLMMAHQNESEIYIMDLERSIEQFVSYAAIEKVKNGCFMSGKYEGGIVNRNCPHMVIFANFPPERTKLSLDRWDVYKINGDKELVADLAEPEFNFIF